MYIINFDMKKKLIYLSGAPRVSSKEIAEMSGPRSHVLGVIGGFESLGWEVEKFIFGDEVPEKWISRGSEKAISSSWIRAFVSDLLRIFFNYRNSFKVYKKYSEKADLVYERFGSFQSLGRVFQKRHIPWVLETNALLSYESKFYRKTLFLSSIAKSFEKRAYQKCDVLVCISEALKEIITNEININPEKICVLPNAVNIDMFDPESHSSIRLHSTFTIGFIGSLYPWSGLDNLFHSVKELKDRDINIKLTIVGDGQQLTTLEELAEKLDIAQDVAFVGRVNWSDIPKYISGFDLCYSGQTQFGPGKMYLSPLKLYEYMSMEKPVVISNFEDARRLIQHGETGFLFDPNNRNELTRVLQDAYVNQKLLVNIGKAGREVIAKNHSWESRIEKLIAFIDKNQLMSS